MIAGVASLLFAALVLVALFLGDARRHSPTVWQLPGRLSLACAVAGALAIAVPMISSWTAPDGVDRIGEVAGWLPQASIALGLIGLVAGGYALTLRYRTWPARAGLVTGALVTAFWLLFLLGEAATP